ncbi:MULTISPECIES: CG0192-related protein [unclassified Rathayibacter]|uniref:CG0192-related protein n=1 Tax=unclassified Rathayibacter TaxID=2609250 RepID=UPI00188D27C4|nr:MULTISPECIES: hypothetical protein [unclassified Rathayibacter]MBF4463072.1 hypothetical protein [Rathayibacter sp. VKM Ac-2879]MBF4504691.1 hypothetical protein [Rathayibacter sp. VKM Ac-2878]
MALLHRATIVPTKLELVEAWAPDQPWCDRGGFTQLGAYRFDDPAGEVGIETLLVQAEGQAPRQLPLTYRGAPLDGAEQWLIGTMHHSVLGERWVYDAAGDPVGVAAFATAIRTGAQQAELYTEAEGERVRRDPTATVQGSGGAFEPVPPPSFVRSWSDERVTVVECDGLTLTLTRVLDDMPLAGAQTLIGCWPGGSPTLLAALS